MTSMNETPRGERLHIGIFGRRNVGKSSLLNAVTGQDLAVVSNVKGTTTDPVFKAMELLPLGPVVFIDTPGIDDYGELGGLRTEKTMDILRKTDVALLVITASGGLAREERELIGIFEETGIKYLIVRNKCDQSRGDGDYINVSAATSENITELKEKIAGIAEKETAAGKLVSDLLSPGDTVILVVPIDSAAPKGRLILPQQQVTRDILDCGATSIITCPQNLARVMENMKSPPTLIVTDSQAFGEVAGIVPKEIPLTSFSIVMARYKGVLEQAVSGVKALDTVKDGDAILISEGCTHHRQCDDIGTVKIPRMIEKYTGVKPDYAFSSGGGFPRDLSRFKLIVHCGGCMLNRREVAYRCQAAENAGVSITNYGVAISYMQGILGRCTEFIVDG